MLSIANPISNVLTNHELEYEWTNILQNNGTNHKLEFEWKNILQNIELNNIQVIENDHSNLYDIDWMLLFNSNIHLSNKFILFYSKFIKWESLTRPLDESMIEIFKLRIRNWTAQLYVPTRSYEFICEHYKAIDWKYVSQRIPIWFNDIHFETFGHLMDWSKMTSVYNNVSSRILWLYKDQIDWEYISKHGIRSESFGLRFMKMIHWELSDLDISNLSTEFLYKYHDLTIDPTLDFEDENEHPIRIGCSISNEFVREHADELDWSELIKRKMINNFIADNFEMHIVKTKLPFTII